MKAPVSRFIRLVAFLLPLLLLTASEHIAAAQATHLIISQLYGGGGNSGSVYSNDFVEIYNPTAADVDLSTYSLQYASTTGTFSSINTLPLVGTSHAGKYFLVQLAPGANTPQALPTADYAPTANVLNLSGTGGKLALVPSLTTLASGCPAVTAYTDYVGWGTANCSYNDATGATRAAATANATALSLGSTNTWTGVNATDYSVIAPNPRTSGSAVVVAPPPTTAIATLQANRSTYLGTSITTTGVVTAVISNGFFIQMPSPTPGSTGVAEGLDVYTSSRPTVSRGDNVTVTGNLVLFPSATSSHTPALEISAPVITTNSTGNSLPTPIVLPGNFPTAGGGIYQLTKYEGMRVTLPSLTTVSGTDGYLTENTETIASSGEFYAVASGTARPFREPGMDFRDFPATTCPTIANCTATVTNAGVARPTNLTLYDDNPERILVESSSAGGTAVDLVAGAMLTNVTGVMDFTYSTDSPYGDPARFFLDAGTVTSANLTASPLTVKALPLPGARQFTVAAFNIERFFNTTDADNFYYDPVTKTSQKIAAANSVVVTADAYARRLKKVSLTIRTVLNNPDILSIEEVENMSVLRDIAAQIDADTTTGTKPGYIAYGTDNVTTFTNDIGGISVGFLVKPSTVNVSAVEQMGAQTTFTPTGATAAQTLNDRPSDVLHATINRGTGTVPYPVTVISNHLRSLSGINTSANTRQKKELQAEMLATLIQIYQSRGEHVVAVGDLNAFQFSDGYTDTLGTITGNVGNGVAAQPGMALVSPAAVDLITTLPAAQQQTYTEFGNAQVLDHVVVSADIAGSSTIAVGHINADFPLISYNDATTAARESDHDPVLTYLALPTPNLSGTLTGTTSFPSTQVSATSSGQVLTLMNTGQGPITITGIATTGDFAQSNNCGTTLAISSSCAINVVFRPTASGARTGSLSVTSNAFCPSNVSVGTCAQFAILTGTATPAPNFTLADGSNATTTSVTVASGGASSFGLTLTSLNGFTGSVALTCASATAPTGASCTVVSPITLAAAGTGVAQVTILTTSRTISAGIGSMPSGGKTAYLILTALLCGVVLMVGNAGRHMRATGLFMLLLALAAGVSGCSSSSTTTNAGGTPAGTYTYMVTATGSGITHTQTINLTVQ